MEATTACAGNPVVAEFVAENAKERILRSIQSLAGWLDEHDNRAHDPFDGLNAWVRPLTMEIPMLRTVLQQGVRRLPWNLRPLLGIPDSQSTKGMAFLARAFMRLHSATQDKRWAVKARLTLRWLMENRSAGFSGACWGNHFDYQCRSFYLPKGVPTVVWTSLIGHAFLDAYEHFHEDSYLNVAASACNHILRDLEVSIQPVGRCISYIPGRCVLVHNANTLGASLLSRTYSHNGNQSYLNLACDAMKYTARHQRPDFSWFYGEAQNLRWVDNFHTAYVLDCFKHYEDATADTRFDEQMMCGYEYWKNTFFLSSGMPRYYNTKALPCDIQCSSQAIDTLVFFHPRDAGSLSLAAKVALWTIENMQAPSGYFYYRRYSNWIVNKTPTLHWGQATMLCALAALYLNLASNDPAFP